MRTFADPYAGSTPQLGSTSQTCPAIVEMNRSSFPRYQMTAVGWKVPLADDRYRPILLKK